MQVNLPNPQKIKKKHEQPKKKDERTSDPKKQRGGKKRKAPAKRNKAKSQSKKRRLRKGHVNSEKEQRRMTIKDLMAGTRSSSMHYGLCCCK